MITGGFRHPVAENVSGFNVVRFRRAAASIGSAEPKLIRAGIDPERYGRQKPLSYSHWPASCSRAS